MRTSVVLCVSVFIVSLAVALPSFAQELFVSGGTTADASRFDGDTDALIDILASGNGLSSASHLASSRDSLLFMGLECTSMGQATLAVVDTTLRIDNIGSSGDDGVSIDLLGAWNHWDCEITHPDSSLELPLGAVLEIAFNKQAGGGGEEEIGVMRTEKIADYEWQLSIRNYPYQDYFLEGYSDGVQVFQFEVVTSEPGDSLYVGLVDITPPTSRYGGRLWGVLDFHWEDFCPVFTWGDDVIYWPPDPWPPYLIDELRVVPQAGTGICPPLSSVNMTAKDIPEMTLTYLHATYDYGTTHNAAIGDFFQNNPDWPDDWFLTEDEYDYVGDFIADFLIEEAGFDSTLCHDMTDSLKQIQSAMGMFYDRDGTTYYGGPVVSDSLCSYRTEFLVDNGYMSSAIASQLVIIHDMAADARSWEDNDAILQYVTDLADSTWTEDDRKAIDAMISVFNESYEYWYDVSHTCRPEKWLVVP